MKDGDFDRLRIPLDDESGSDELERDEDAQQRLGVAASPVQLAAGSAIVAGLILLGVAALRRRRGSGSGPAGTGGSG
jgi:uncharacterized protein (TIGR03382 family)